MIKISNWHFEILGVTKKATSEEIKKAFKSLIKKNHPDLFPHEKDKLEATRESQKLIEAYDLLKNYNSPENTQRPTESSVNSNTKQKAECDWKNIDRIRVKSSNVYAVGYDPLTNTLIIEFESNKSIYLYFNVPIDVYETFLNAESKGRFMSYFGAYKYSCVLG